MQELPSYAPWMTPFLLQDYLLKGAEAKPEIPVKPVEEAPASPALEEVVPEKIEETPAVVVENNSEVPAGTVEASTEASDASSGEEKTENPPEESSENAPDAEPTSEEGNGSSEEAAEIKVVTRTFNLICVH